VVVHDVFLSDCPARTTLSLISNTWTVVVLVALGEQPMRYSELLTRNGGVSKKILTHTLANLNDRGLVTRRAADPRQYELTSLGVSLLEPIDQLVRWAEDHGADLL
jgi:DNA-binding HxlR family transcriptional regulator